MMRPRRSEQATTLLPTNKEIRAPQIRRERMSRPSSSVPHQCCVEGVCKRFGRSMCAGSCGAIQGAKIAAKTKMDTNTPPMAASGLWRATRGSEMAREDMVSRTYNRFHALILGFTAEYSKSVRKFTATYVNPIARIDRKSVV